MRTWFRSLLMPLSLLGILLFVLPWLWVLSAPAPRGLFVKQITGNTGFAPTVPWAGLLPYPYGTRPGILEPLSVNSSLAANFITDPYVQAKIADEAARVAPTPASAPKSVELGLYKTLIKRFPRESWLYAHYLRTAVGSFQDERIGGAFSSAVVTSPYANAPETTGALPNFTRPQLDEALEIARQGQITEPDNAFFGLCEGVLLWMGHRDAEAWRALHRASLLPRFDEHTSEEAEAIIKVAELQRGPMIWEERMSLSAAILFPQYAKLREKGRQWSWAAWKLERAGHHQEAITKRADIARLFAKTQHGRNSLIGGLVGAAIQAIAWNGNPNRKVRRNQLATQQPTDLSSTTRLAAQKFALYARAHGETAIAEETVRQGESGAYFRLLTHAAIADFAPDNISPSIVRQTRALWWAGCEILGSGVLVGITWLATSVLLIGAGGERARARFVAPVVAFCAGVLTLIYTWYSGALAEEFWTYPNVTLSPQAMRSYEVLQGIAFLLPLGLPALLCGIPTWWRQWRTKRTLRRNAAPNAGKSIAQPSAESRQLPRDMRPLIGAFFAGCAALGTLGGWVVAAILWVEPTYILPVGSTQNVEGIAALVALFALLSSALWLMGWIVKYRFLMPITQRPLAHSALRRFNAVMGVLLVLSSWSYAFTLAAAIGPRHEATRLSDMELQLGEIGAYEATHPELAAAHPVQSQRVAPPRSTP